jgi:transposase
MGKFHSLDIRERVVSMVDSGQSRRAAARHFCVSESAAIKLLRHRAVTGTIAPLRQGRPPGSGKLSAYLRFLIGEVERKPDITMPELADKLDGAHGVRVPPSSLSRVLVAQGFTYKKSPDGIGTRTRDGAAGP